MTSTNAAAPERRPLGRSGIAIAPLVFGGNVFGWTADEPTSFTLIDRFLDGGFNCIDTADVYSRFAPGNVGGESETIIGNWLARGGHRDRLVIATKVGMDMGEDRKGLSRRWIMQAAEDSLRRLKTDHIDLYQSHQADPATPQEETLRAYEDLIAQGKVRAIGASNFDAAQLREALDLSEAKHLPRYETLQPGYSLADRAFEGPLQDLCAAEGVGVITYFSLAGGFLTGKYRSEADLAGRARARIAGQWLNPRGLAVLASLDQVAEQLSATQAQVALAWLMTRKAVVAPIASATSVPQLDELMGAARLRLSPEQVAQLDAASA